jgi:hypothetical protein
MTDELQGMNDPPQVVEITVEWHRDGRGWAGLGHGARRALAICAAALLVVAAAIVAGSSSSSPGRTAAARPLPSAVRCENPPAVNVFFAYRPPRTTPPAKPAACP